VTIDDDLPSKLARYSVDLNIGQHYSVISDPQYYGGQNVKTTTMSTECLCGNDVGLNGGWTVDDFNTTSRSNDRYRP